MTAPALIRVRLDTSGAKADLADLYNAAGKGIRIPATPGGGGGGGGGFGPIPGAGFPGGVGGGGFNVGAMLSFLGRAAPLIGAAVALGGPTIRDAGTLASGVLGGIGRQINPLDMPAAEQRGRARLGEEMAQQFGLAKGLGLMSDADVKGVFDARKGMFEAEERGKSQILNVTGWESVKDIFDRMVTALESLAGGTR